MTPEEKLIAARCKLLTVMPFYGHICLPIKWTKSEMSWLKEKDKTMGVCVRNGRAELIWYDKFVDQRTVSELMACIQHEIEHLMRMHCQRRSSRLSFLWQFVTDACVNGKKSAPRIGYNDVNKLVLPLGDKSKELLIWIPDNLPDNETAEWYYDKLLEDADLIEAAKYSCKPDGMVGDHSVWNQTEMSPEDIRQIVHDLVAQAVTRAAGNVPGHVTALLKELSSPIISWQHILKRFMGQHVGNRRWTYSRRNRRLDTFGTAGISRHAAGKVLVIVDTSGSISDDDRTSHRTDTATGRR